MCRAGQDHILLTNPATLKMHMCRAGQNHIYSPFMTVSLVTSQPKIPCINRIYMVLANPTNVGPFRLLVRL